MRFKGLSDTAGIYYHSEIVLQLRNRHFIDILAIMSGAEEVYIACLNMYLPL